MRIERFSRFHLSFDVLAKPAHPDDLLEKKEIQMLLPPDFPMSAFPNSARKLREKYLVTRSHPLMLPDTYPFYRFTVSLVDMQIAVAEVQIGKHRFLLTVQEQSEGIYSSDILDLDREAHVAGNSVPRMVGEMTLRQTIENAEEDAETDLSLYIASIGEEWPKGIHIEWNERRSE